MEILVLIIILLFLAVRTAIRYDPALDLVVSNKKYSLLLWYNKYGNNNEKKRVYVKLL